MDHEGLFLQVLNIHTVYYFVKKIDLIDEMVFRKVIDIISKRL